MQSLAHNVAKYHEQGIVLSLVANVTNFLGRNQENLHLALNGNNKQESAFQIVDFGEI